MGWERGGLREGEMGERWTEGGGGRCHYSLDWTTVESRKYEYSYFEIPFV